MKRFYSSEISVDTARLSEQESHHAMHVLRCSAGETVEVVDGKGHLWQGILSPLGKKIATVTALELLKEEAEDPQKLILAVAPTKNADRLEWLVEKATELGIRAIIPIISTRTERSRVNTERLVQIAIAAMKQSGHLYLPEIWPLTPIGKIWSIPASQHFLAHCYEDTGKKLLNLAYQPNATAIVAIGPEGDFSPEEVREAVAAGWQAVSLGNSRLRVETAALYAVTMIKMNNEQ